jgi:hypothetical protein
VGYDDSFSLSWDPTEWVSQAVRRRSVQQFWTVADAVSDMLRQHAEKDSTTGTDDSHGESCVFDVLLKSGARRPYDLSVFRNVTLSGFEQVVGQHGKITGYSRRFELTVPNDHVCLHPIQGPTALEYVRTSICGDLPEPCVDSLTGDKINGSSMLYFGQVARASLLDSDNLARLDDLPILALQFNNLLSAIQYLTNHALVSRYLTSLLSGNNTGS